MMDSATSTNRSDERPRILLAEDDGELRDLLSSKIEELGIEVIVCEHGLALVEELDRAFGEDGVGGIDMIVSDIRMPGVTGMSVLEGFQFFENSCPIILMTGFGDTETQAEATRLGAAAFFRKPFKLNAFLKCIEKLAWQKRSTDSPPVP